MATTSWPRRRLLEFPSRAAGSDDVVDHAQQGEVGVRIVAQHARLDGARVGQRQPHRRRALHDMAVGQHQAVGRDHHARAGAAALALLAVGRSLDPHDGRADAIDDVDHRLRIGVEQRPFVGVGFCGDTCFRRISARRRREGAGSRTCPYMGSVVRDVTVLPDRDPSDDLRSARAALQLFRRRRPARCERGRRGATPTDCPESQPELDAPGGPPSEASSGRPAGRRSNKSSVGGAMTAHSPHSVRFNGCPKRPNVQSD